MKRTAWPSDVISIALEPKQHKSRADQRTEGSSESVASRSSLHPCTHPAGLKNCGSRRLLATPSFWHQDLPSSPWKDTLLLPDANEWSAKICMKYEKSHKEAGTEKVKERH